MHIVLDAREAFDTQKTGKGQWTAAFLRELSTRNISLTVLTDDRAPMGGNFVRLPSGPLWHLHAVFHMRRRRDAFYVSPTSFIVPSLLHSSLLSAVVVHDVIAFRPEPHERKARMLERIFLPRALRKARHVFTISDTTKADICAAFPFVLPHAVTTIFAGPMEHSPPRGVPDGRTILCAGTLCPRKNQLRLIDAYASLPSDLRKQYRLLLIGARGWHDASIVRNAERTKGVEWIGYTSDTEYVSHLSAATVLALPSLYEGFGMQVLDALQRGIPVLASNRGSLPEIVGNAGVLVDPERTDSIAHGLASLLRDGDLRQRLQKLGPIQARKFSWKYTVDSFLEALQ